MAILKRYIPDGDQDYTAGAVVDIDLPRENYWRRVFLHFDLDGNSATNVTTSSIADAFQQINVIADNQIIKSYRGSQLASLNCLNYGGSLIGSQIDQQADKDSGDDFAMCIDFGLSPTDYRHMIASAELSSFRIQIVWAPIAALDAHSTTPTFDGNLKIHSDEVVADDIPADKLGIIQERRVSKLMTGTDEVEDILKLPLGNIYRRFVVWCYQSDIYKLFGGELMSTYFDRFSVVHNGNVTLQTGYTEAFVYEDMFDYRQLGSVGREGETLGTDWAYYEDPLVVDFDKDVSNLDEVIDTARSSSLEFKFINTTTPDGSNDFVEIVTQEIIP
jgi:hypothetical protein